MIKSNGAVVVPSPSSATNSLVGGEIHDIRPLVHVPDDWFWVSWITTALVGVFIVWKVWRLIASLPPAAERKPKVSPEQKAHQQLDLALRHLLDPKLFCSAASDVLRFFLEERFRFHAPERTTEEFLNELQQSSRLNDDQKTLLANFLERCDLVKFARHEPAETELRELHSVAHRLVDDLSQSTTEPAAALLKEEDGREIPMESPEVVKRAVITNASLAVLSMGFGGLMWIWSSLQFLGPNNGSQRWLILSRLLDAVWSRPLGIALMVLGFVYICAAAIRKPRRVAT